MRPRVANRSRRPEAARAGRGARPSRIDELLSTLDAHREASGRRTRSRTQAAMPAMSMADAGAPAASDAACGSAAARLASLVARDGVCRTFGIAILSGGAGHAEVAITVAARHLNFNGCCHRGPILALADGVGLASNSHGPWPSASTPHHVPAARRARLPPPARATEIGAAAGSASTASTWCGRKRTGRKRCPAFTAPSSSRHRAPLSRGYTGWVLSCSCRHNHNAASKFFYSGELMPSDWRSAGCVIEQNTTFLPASTRRRTLAERASRCAKDLGIWQTFRGAH